MHKVITSALGDREAGARQFAAIFGFVPAMLIALFWSGGRISALFQPEFSLLLVSTAVLNGIFTAGASLHSRFWTSLLR